MRIYTIAVALALAAAPATSLFAQGGDGGPGRGQRLLMGPAGGVGALLANADELGLSETQLTQLEAIQRQLQELNAPLLEQVGGGRALRRGDGAAAPPTPQERENMQGSRDEMNPVMQQLRENTLAAMEQAQAVLSAEQREQARELLAARGPAADRMGRADRVRPQR